MSVEEAMAPVPGWYADPTGGSQLRWWSGAGWTDHVAPTPAAEPESAVEREAADTVSAGLAVRPTPMTRREARMALAADGSADSQSTPIPTAPVAEPAPVETTSEPDPAPVAPPIPPELPASTSTGTASAGARETAPIPAPEQPWWTPTVSGQEDELAPAAPEWRPMPQSTSFNTGDAWTIAAVPMLGVVISILLLIAASVIEPRATIGALLLGLPVSVILSKRDRTQLTEREISPLPSQWWLLLGPVFYLASRFRKIAARGGTGGAGPFWLGLGSTLVALPIVGLIVVTMLVGAALDQPTSAFVSETLERDLRTAGHPWTVTCEDGLDLSVGSTFSCPVIDEEGVATSVSISVIEEDGTIYYSVVRVQ